MAKKTSKKKSKRKTIKILLLIALFFAILLIALVIVRDLSNNVDEYNNEPRLFVIEDECSLVLNRLIHQIADEDTCRIKCNVECEIYNSVYNSSEFIERNASCNLCNCYCK